MQSVATVHRLVTGWWHLINSLSPVVAVCSPDITFNSLHYPTQYVYTRHKFLTINNNISPNSVNRLVFTIRKQFFFFTAKYNRNFIYYLDEHQASKCLNFQLPLYYK
jgi:hypothetical protein